jgi:hypothetical protein
MDQLEQSWIRQPVMDVAPLAARHDDPGFAQGHQVLRQVCLPPAESRLEMAYALPSITNCKQNLKSRRLAYCL